MTDTIIVSLGRIAGLILVVWAYYRCRAIYDAEYRGWLS